ncbi:MAG: metallophosphoesterase, partial [Pedobacter sp.]
MKRKINLLPFIIIAILFLLLNGYILSGLAVVVSSKLLIPIFWFTILALSVSIILAIKRMRKNGVDKFFTIATHAFLVVFIAELIFAIFLLVGDIYRFFLGLASNFEPEGFQYINRSANWIGFSLIMFALTVVMFIYGITRGKYAYRVIKHTLYYDDLPQAFDGFTLTQISDVHAGSFTKPNQVQKGIDLINSQKSDLFVFTGDLVNNAATEIKPYIEHFSQIKAPFGQFSVLGNHDYGDYIKWPSEIDKTNNLQQLKNYHAELGFKLLLDEHVELHKDGAKIILAGVENWGIGFGERGDLKKALFNTGDNDFKILLSHDPT